MTRTTPSMRPRVPHFSSGPCAKRPGWTAQALSDAVLGRSHRSKAGKAKLKRAIDLTREVLQVPAEYRIGIVPASDTGAVEMALWSLLGPRPVTMLAWESFGEGWVVRYRQGAEAQGRDRPARAVTASFPILPADPGHDIVFAWNGTTSGVRVPNADWIAADRDRTGHLRRHIGGVCAKARLAEARCRNLLLAEGARRRGRPTAC